MFLCHRNSRRKQPKRTYTWRLTVHLLTDPVAEEDPLMEAACAPASFSLCKLPSHSLLEHITICSPFAGFYQLQISFL